jgi:hypothetical protein
MLAAEYIIDHAQRPERRPVQMKVECRLIERLSVSGYGSLHAH